ncbi:uncharacterized protein LOC132698189 [Cylas formicarius]|uniref:uncharacterized protein LOC132698189 n=1 Tax=Cylas formicarius TaxID=197179 RepID=UPI0029584FA4|nr:uncharacterized protein LOC132698189 [Cylas formicarius]
MDFVKRFFGFKGSDSHNYQYPHQFNEDFKSLFDNFEESANVPKGFDAIRDPFEMHKYFEEQMDHILRNFGLHDFGTNFRLFRTPALDEGEYDQNSDLREHFLKKGYKVEPTIKKQDTDLDADLQAGNLDLFLDNNKISKKLPPFKEQGTPHFFQQSVSVKSIRKPDGTIEIQQTIKSNDGAEETTITQRKGNKEYSVITRKDKHGQEEVVENLLNMEDADKEKFLSRITPSISDNPSNLYDRFFGKTS